MSDHIPTWVRDLANRMRQQDNAATAHPLFIVQQRKRVFGADDLWGPSGSVWILTEDPEFSFETRDDAIEDLLEGADSDDDPATIDLTEFGYAEVHYYEYMEFVCAHLTRTAAERYIEENSHNLTEPRIYVSSQYRCHEFNRLVEWLMTLATVSDGVPEPVEGGA